jgi:hypothetical protein
MPQDEKGLLLRLRQGGVEFVVIGGVCGILHGITLVTQDLDVCCRFTPENLRRLESALKDLHPRHRLTANPLPFELTDELCTRLKNVYLKTDIGIIDCLSFVSGVGDFEQVLKRSIVQSMSYGDFRILDIDALIAAKEAVGRERDLVAVKMLRAIKEENEKQPKLF